MNDSISEIGSIEKNRPLAKHIRQRTLTTLEANHLFADALGVSKDLAGQPLLTAVALLPLAEVAWCDGEVSGFEKGAILRAAAELAIVPHSPLHAILQTWLTQRPSRTAVAAWRAYVRALVAAVDASTAASIEAAILGRAEKIAEAAGGYLGISKISAKERACLDELATAFA